MRWVIVRGFLTIGLRQERYTRNRFISIAVIATSNLAIGSYLFQVASKSATVWTHDDIFRILGWLFLLGAINTYIAHSPSHEETDFLSMLPVRPLEKILARIAHSVAVNAWSFLAVSGLYWGWALHRPDVNYLMGALGCTGLFLQMNFTGLIIEHILKHPGRQVLRGILVRATLIVLLLTLMSLLLVGTSTAQIGVLLKPLSVLLGMKWYARAASSLEWWTSLTWMAVGISELLGTGFFTWFLVSRSQQDGHAVTGLRPRRRFLPRDESLAGNRTSFSAHLHKDASLMLRNWHVLLGGILSAVLIGAVMVIVARQTGQLLRSGEPFGDIVSVLMAVSCGVGPSLIMIGGAYSQDYDFLWLIRLACKPAHYVLSKFFVPVGVGTLISTCVAVAQYRVFHVNPFLWFLASSLTVSVVSALGLWIGAARLNRGAGPKQQDPVSWVLLTLGVYLYTVFVVVSVLLVGMGAIVYLVAPASVLLVWGALHLAGWALWRQDLSH